MERRVADQKPLDIVFEGDGLIAIDKPAGLLVHRTKLDARETRFAMQRLRDQVGCRVYPVHRLDKPTSGILLFATSAEEARLVSDLFALRKVQKTYRAVVRGWTVDDDAIDYPLKEIRDKTTDGKARSDKAAQTAITAYRTLARCEVDHPVGRYPTARYSLVEVRPETGRKNQIRRHFKHIFHPILGDRKFGDRSHNAFLRSGLKVERMLLAATGLSFMHPASEERISIVCSDGFPACIHALFRNGSDPQTASGA
ncbi:MAG: pseudouridylate synthase [Bacteroidetes bacterium]|nr:pseudouridylate synthase [Bacteroidota bacterium]